jgi:hypothetical protein
MPIIDWHSAVSFVSLLFVLDIKRSNSGEIELADHAARALPTHEIMY